MCRSLAHGGRRCTGAHPVPVNTTPSTASPLASSAVASSRAEHDASTTETTTREASTRPGAQMMTRKQFLATPVRELATINPDGTVTVEPQPRATSERTYRDHLASGPRMVVRSRDADTAGLPERLWGGARYSGLDPESARVMSESMRAKGSIVTVTWEDDDPQYGYSDPRRTPGAR
jgi:hypothetical protein